MEKKPIVSVIIPTYGVPIFLEQSIKSVQAQTIDNWELIIVDDNNPNTEAREKTEECIRGFSGDERIKYIQHEKNKNGAAARNTGIAVAKGEYIAFLDSDDFYCKTRLERCLAQMSENTDTSVAGVYTGCEFRRGGEKYHVETNVQSGNFILETLACTFKFCTGSNIFMKAAVVKELMFDESFLRHQDYEFLVRFFTQYSLNGITEVLVIKNNENFNVPNYTKNVEIKKLYLSKYADIIEKMPTIDKNYIFSSHCLSLANIAASSGMWSKAYKCLKVGNKYQRITIKEKTKTALRYINSIRKKKA